MRQYLGNSIDRKELQECLDGLVEEYSTRGIVLHDVAGGYQFRTHPASSTWIQKLIAGRPVRLSRAQLDTLAIVAYRQPITRPEIDDIRGVDSGSTLKVLLDRNLLRVLGKKEEPGRPLLYGTSKDFLEFFNLAELRDLPTLREFHELNDDGMAQVDKLGADIKGVDVGAVAAEVAAEREAQALLEAQAKEALAEEKRLAKEAARAERQAAKEAASNENARPDEMDEGNETTTEEPFFAAHSARNDETPEDVVMAGRRHDDTESDTEAGTELGTETFAHDEDATRLDVSPAPEKEPERDPDTLLEYDRAATDTEIATSMPVPDATVVDRMPDAQPSSASDFDMATEINPVPDATMPDLMEEGLDGLTEQNIAPGDLIAEQGIDELTIVPSDSTD
jgi:segregation and condensation protein B